MTDRLDEIQARLEAATPVWVPTVPNQGKAYARILSCCPPKKVWDTQSLNICLRTFFGVRTNYPYSTGQVVGMDNWLLDRSGGCPALPFRLPVVRGRQSGNFRIHGTRQPDRFAGRLVVMWAGRYLGFYGYATVALP